MARLGLRLCYQREREREREREMFRLRERDPLRPPLGTNPRVQVRAGQSIILKKKNSNKHLYIINKLSTKIN